MKKIISIGILSIIAIILIYVITVYITGQWDSSIWDSRIKFVQVFLLIILEVSIVWVVDENID